MKHNYLATLVAIISIISFSNHTFAQGGYMNFNVGYAFPLGGQTLTNETRYRAYDDFGDLTIGTNAYEQISYSLGKGFNVGGALGYMFNEHIGAELGVSYLIGAESLSTYSNTEIDPFNSIPYSYAFESLISSKMLRIIPSLVISAGGEKIKPYAKFGLVFGKGSVTIENSYQSSSSWDGISFETEISKLSGGTALGLSSALGASIKLSDKMSFFGEINMINMSYAPTNGELIEATSNGVNTLPLMTTAEIETEFVDSYTINNINNTNPFQPSQELKQRLPFGSSGINVVSKINF